MLGYIVDIHKDEDNFQVLILGNKAPFPAVKILPHSNKGIYLTEFTYNKNKSIFRCGVIEPLEKQLLCVSRKEILRFVCNVNDSDMIRFIRHLQKFESSTCNNDFKFNHTDLYRKYLLANRLNKVFKTVKVNEDKSRRKVRTPITYNVAKLTGNKKELRRWRGVLSSKNRSNRSTWQRFTDLHYRGQPRMSAGFNTVKK